MNKGRSWSGIGHCGCGLSENQGPRLHEACVVITCGRKPSPRTEYRLRRNTDINNSAFLSEKFPSLKTLKVDIEYFDANGTTRTGGMKYKVNLAHSKSLFCI